jgi:hypothetical protein
MTAGPIGSAITKVLRKLPAVLLAVGLAALVFPLPQAGAANNSLRSVGQLQEPPAADRLAGTGRVMVIDEAKRRLYYQYFATKDQFAMHLRQYDLSGATPKLLRDARFGSPEEIPTVNDLSPNTVTIDTKRNRLYLLTVSSQPVGCPDDPFCGTPVPAPVKLFVFDLTTFQRLPTINVQLVVPAFGARGISYSEEDDRLYMIGEVQPGGALKLADLTGGFPRTFPAAVAAIDAATAGLSWVKLVPECDVPLATLNNGVMIRRSRFQPALYFACVRPFVYPGMSGVIRLWIDPKGTLAEAQNFPLEFFPISGSYADEVGILGLASFDAITDRFYMQSLASGAPGAWVFDGGVSAWVGFIVSPDTTNGYAGLNQRTGRFYMGGGGTDALTGYVVVADGRRTPVPQGVVVRQGFGLRDQLIVDGISGRIFMQVETAKSGGERDWLIFEDLTVDPDPETPTDYDSLTVDVAESAATISSFAGDIQGWGMRAVLVGGRGGLTSFCTGSTTINCEATLDQVVEAAPENEDVPSIVLFKGTRAIHASRVGSLDVRNVGAAASAQALSLDPISDAEYREKVQKTAHDRAAAVANEDTAEQVRAALEWPHHPSTCLDAQGEKVSASESGQGGKSDVSCDLSSYDAKAAASFGLFALGDSSTPLRLEIGSSSFATHSYRDEKLGVVTETTAISEDVSLGGASIGSVSIGRVVAKAVTSAKGRPGTASAEWTRTLEHVIVRSTSGDVVFECSKASDCAVGQAIDAINDVLKTRIRVTAPEAHLVESPRGAFASVDESDKQYLDGLIANEDENRAIPGLEITVFNDGVQRSRLVLQLAALQSSSIYGISLLSVDTGGPGFGGTVPLPSVGPLPIGPDVPIFSGPVAAPPVANGGPIVKIGRTAMFLIRSPKEAFLFGLTTLLFAAAIGAGWRRVVLIRGLS